MIDRCLAFTQGKIVGTLMYVFPPHSRSEPMSLRRTFIRSLLLGAALPVAAIAAVLPHAKLKSSLPSAGTTVAAPKELRLTFSEKIEIKIAKITLLRGTEELAALGDVAADSQATETVVIPVTKPLAAGSYTVKYRVAGPDGHPMGGSYVFSVK
ncbi:MAG TPA: copper resistance protein CopC [Gemmatimonas aurantiaca]|nr:copper resistance protein CopC [Gemmatimonas aurantiaca]